MFLPVQIRTGTTAGGRVEYDRGINVLGDRLMALELHAQDMTVPLTAIGSTLRAAVAAQMASQGGTGASGRWTPLSEAYAAWKESKVPGVPMLVGIRPGEKGSRSHQMRGAPYGPSGAMRNSLLDPLAMHIGPRRLLYSPESPIAGFHQEGTSRMPARPVVSLSLQLLRAFDREFVRWINALVEGLGL